jgi:hypothetical protein
MGDVIQTDRGDIALPDLGGAARHGTNDDAGEFLINLVATPFPSKAYTIVISAPGYGLFIADSMPVLPGAVMSLNVDAQVRKGVNVLFEPGDRNAPLRYRHEMEIPGPVQRSPTAPSTASDRVAYTVYATREGLVGYSTANGHVIRERDHFVALPSTRVLNANDQVQDFKVRLAYAGRTVDAPVWDVGPWNVSDDYWNPSSIRQKYGDLPQGMPEAQAAYQNGYNGGLSELGRRVTVPTAIDLADGTFWDDLGMVGNNWVSAAFLWKPNVVLGDRVYAAMDTAVRATPAGNQIATEVCGMQGVITGGPSGASLNRVYNVWWQIQWDNAVPGWSAENQLGKAAALLARVNSPIHHGNNGISVSAFLEPQNATGDFKYYLPVISKQPPIIVCPPWQF